MFSREKTCYSTSVPTNTPARLSELRTPQQPSFEPTTELADNNPEGQLGEEDPEDEDQNPNAGGSGGGGGDGDNGNGGGGGGGGPPGGGSPGDGPPSLLGLRSLDLQRPGNLDEGQVLTFFQQMGTGMNALTTILNNMNNRLPDSDSGKTRVKDPDVFDGSDPQKLRTFLVSLSFVFLDCPSYFTEAWKINYTLSYLGGTAWEWFEPDITQPSGLDL
ncbi:hypothetical protein GYMLUDRAFT_252736 [Collybiopsis luxurians FD-317 M1]|uniref:Unplaced genomic scaffold GYMLUscaffold_140, whole genome shotgun sequence n=1 Tax=Collybiopsis luxurians FD-317 M1 TaxID=944289 RepID=A0A0D0AKG3_9AGAR|nr:hypothetical protein GYMLUDRAFT_252736 [Collybiopsis luxurians FD-317 M1]